MKICNLLPSIFMLLVSAQSAQELIDSVLNPSPGSEHYSSYSSQIYINHTLYNQTPIASTNYDRLEASANSLLPPPAYDYAAGGSGLEKTVAANREAFNHVSHPQPCYPTPAPAV
jgi:lactate 2-monooxygenase